MFLSVRTYQTKSCLGTALYHCPAMAASLLGRLMTNASSLSSSWVSTVVMSVHGFFGLSVLVHLLSFLSLTGVLPNRGTVPRETTTTWSLFRGYGMAQTDESMMSSICRIYWQIVWLISSPGSCKMSPSGSRIRSSP